MIILKLDMKGTRHVRWPNKTTDILRLAQTYIAHESALPAAQQIAAPTLAQIQAAFTAASTAHTEAKQGEDSRASAAERYRQTLTLARSRLNTAIVRLKSQYLANLAQLEQWGLQTVTNERGVTVRKPRTQREWVAFLAHYVAKETSLPPAAQIADPPLAEMSALNEVLQTAVNERTVGQNQRETNVQNRLTEIQQLLELLQAAALILVVTRHQGIVTNSLQSWGYQVIAAS